MTRKTLVIGALGTAGALAAAAPIVGQSGTPGSGGVAAQVSITDATYLPGDVVVGPGQRVVWKNTGAAVHTVTSDTGVFDSGSMAPKATWELAAPATAGTYPYTCTFHVYMKGRLVVTALTMSGPTSVKAGKPATLKGVVPGGAAGTPVNVSSLRGTTWTTVKSTALGADGSFSVTTPALSTATTFRAEVGADVSPSVDVAVAPVVTLRRVKSRLMVTVRPSGTVPARLEMLNLNTYRWRSVKSVRVVRGKASVMVKKPGRYRVTVLPRGGLAAAHSPAVRVK